MWFPYFCNSDILKPYCLHVQPTSYFLYIQTPHAIAWNQIHTSSNLQLMQRLHAIHMQTCNIIKTIQDDQLIVLRTALTIIILLCTHKVVFTNEVDFALCTHTLCFSFNYMFCKFLILFFIIWVWLKCNKAQYSKLSRFLRKVCWFLQALQIYLSLN